MWYISFLIMKYSTWRIKDSFSTPRRCMNGMFSFLSFFTFCIIFFNKEYKMCFLEENYSISIMLSHAYSFFPFFIGSSIYRYPGSWLTIAIFDAQNLKWCEGSMGSQLVQYRPCTPHPWSSDVKNDDFAEIFFFHCNFFGNLTETLFSISLPLLRLL